MSDTNNAVKEKRPALFLWLVCHVSFIIFPLSVVILDFLVKIFGMTQNVLTMLLASFLSFQIISLYSRLDYEVTEYVKTKGDD